jgi:glycosyltransferase involved in cell wall biosynthesis
LRAAIVIPTEWQAASFTTDPRILAGGFEAIGHQAKIVCLSGSAYPPEAPAVALSRTAMEDAEWWREQRFDLALVFTWLHSHQGVVEGIAKSGTFVISKGDTHGLYGARAHPRKTLVAAIQSTDDPLTAARNAWYWCKRIFLSREHVSHARPFVANLREADVTVVETDVARTNLCRFLDSIGASDLIAKLHVVPNPSALPFVMARVPERKERLIYAAGRWESPPKNVELLIRVLEQYLSRDQSARAVIAGSGTERFRHVRTSRIQHVGQVERETLAEIAAQARVCLVTSRWESFHIAAHEALTVGATVVGTPIPVVQSMTSGGRYGTMARSHRVPSVHSALVREMHAWDIDRRDSLAIASDWRSRLAPASVASQLLGLMPD